MRDRIFVSYRKGDARDAAGRLADRLKHHFGVQRVFFDTDDIAVGDRWQARIDRGLERAAVMLVVVGSQWTTIRCDRGRRRLDDPEDVVRREIETALGGQATVFLVRVNGAPMPRREELPASLHRLLDIQGERLRTESLDHQTFTDDVDRLLRDVSRLIKERRGSGHTAWRDLQPARKQNRLINLARGLLYSPFVPPRITRRLAPNPFLRQDPRADLIDYKDEIPLTPYLPYVEVMNWTVDIAEGRRPDVRVKVLPGRFELESWGDGDGDAIRDAAHAAAIEAHPKRFDGPAVRVDAVSTSQKTCWLTVQKAGYFDQSRSNLVLDYAFRTTRGNDVTLRELLHQQYGYRLPPLADARLANTLGVAALILVRDGDELTPYFVSRSREVAVFNYGGEWHCTASGVAEFDDRRPDRNEHFHHDTMLKELMEEVGLLEHDLDYLAPVAMCREMTRAGKPQMFFLGVTALDRETLKAKLTGARRRTKQKGWVVENTAMPLWRKPSEISDTDALQLFHDHGFTIEAAACLHYYLKCRSLA